MHCTTTHKRHGAHKTVRRTFRRRRRTGKHYYHRKTKRFHGKRSIFRTNFCLQRTQRPQRPNINEAEAHLYASRSAWHEPLVHTVNATRSHHFVDAVISWWSSMLNQQTENNNKIHNIHKRWCEGRSFALSRAPKLSLFLILFNLVVNIDSFRKTPIHRFQTWIEWECLKCVCASMLWCLGMRCNTVTSRSTSTPLHLFCYWQRTKVKKGTHNERFTITLRTQSATQKAQLLFVSSAFSHCLHLTSLSGRVDYRWWQS